MKTVKNLLIRQLKKHLWKLPDDMLNRAVSHAVIHRRVGALANSRRIPRREDVWRAALDAIGANRKILFLEFGVFEGESIRYFSKALTHPGSRLVGFDSFEGLPEDWGHRATGSYSAKGKIPDIQDERASFAVGWFQDTLPPMVFDASQFDAVLVHLDADLYSSTLFVLTELWRRFPKTYAIFDEFVGDEARALYNFTQAFPTEVSFIAHDTFPPKRIACVLSRMGFNQTKENAL